MFALGQLTFAVFAGTLSHGPTPNQSSTYFDQKLKAQNAECAMIFCFSSYTHEVDQLPGHLVLLLLQVFYLEVKLRKFLVNPVQSRPYHSGEKSIYIIPHYCCKLEMHLHNAVSLSLRSEPLRDYVKKKNLFQMGIAR